jgi:hypothetical protein
VQRREESVGKLLIAVAQELTTFANGVLVQLHKLPENCHAVSEIN